jgi:hypothetical protein
MKPNTSFKNSNSNKFYQSIKNKTSEIGFAPDYLANEKDRTNFGNKLDWQQKTKDVEFLLSKKGLSVSVAAINPGSKKFLGSYTVASQLVCLQEIVGSGSNKTITKNLSPGMYVFGYGIKPNTTIKKIQSGNRIIISQKPVSSGFRTIYFSENNLTGEAGDVKSKRMGRSKNDSSLYLNIKNYYESNNRFFDFTRNKTIVFPPPTPTPTGYEVIAYFLSDLYVDLSLISTKSLLYDVHSTVDLNVEVETRKSKLYSNYSEVNLNISFDQLGECIIDGGHPITNNFSFMLFGGKPNTEGLISIEQWCRITQNNF